ncbi:MAG: hypothetical protein ACJ760_16140 [Thermoleophilaceae bacterium]
MTRFRRLPVRFRLAAICAGLTFAILALFAVGVAVFSAHQVHSGFDKDLRATRPVLSPGGVTVGAFQYGKPSTDAGHTIARIRLFLVLGLIAGTALAFLAALRLARRTMTPNTA